MAKRRRKGQAKPKANVPQNNSAAAEQQVVSNDDPQILTRKQSTGSSTSAENHTSVRRKTSTPSSNDLGKDTSPSSQPNHEKKGPASKLKRSQKSAGNMHEEVPLKRSRSSSAKPSTSTQEMVNSQNDIVKDDVSGSNDATERVSLKRKDTLIIEPSTSATTGASFRAPTLSMRSTIAGPSTSAQTFTTPRQLIKIASLKKGLSRQEIESILPEAASLSDKTLSSITKPTTSDPETKALIAKSMELMRRASLRPSKEAPEEEPDADGENELPLKERKLSLQKSKSQQKSVSEKISVSQSLSVKDASSVQEANESKEDVINEDVQIVSEVHPDCDPVYIREQLLLLVDDPQRVSTVTFNLFSATNLPTRADREAIDALKKREQELLNLVLDVDSFLKRFPDPITWFETDRARVRSKDYVEHAHVFLKNKFPAMAATYMYKVLSKVHNCLPAAYDKLKEEYDAWLAKGGKAANKQKYLKNRRTEDSEYPDLPNEEFYYERLYINHKQEILDRATDKAKEKEQAKLEGKLQLCEICYIDDLMSDDMLPCQGGHAFCKDCVKMSALEQIGNGRANISCLESGCSEVFQFSVLEKILPVQQSAILLARMQTEEVQKAEIDGVESCPFCPYSVVIPTEYPASVLFCEGPNCKVASCRNCKEVDHLPMTCDEFLVEKGKRFKEFIENSLSDAIIRECHSCHLRFFKQEGCNFMTCSSCGANMCYVCRQPIRGYDHFRNNPSCSQYVNIELFHRAEVLEAYNQMGQRFRQAHPEMGAVEEVPDVYRPDDV